ncbi:MAG: hypothetical protein AB1Z98_40310, partial [Nannocystaceae bacterium]
MRLQEQDLVDARTSPSALAAYLRSAGWHKGDDLIRRGTRTATQFVSSEGGTAVWLPLLPEAKDYGRLLALAVNTIAQRESRAPMTVLDDVRLTRADMVRVRRPERQDHLLP